MLRSISIEKGQTYDLRFGLDVIRVKFLKPKHSELLFENVRGGPRLPIDRDDFIAMRSNGDAVLLVEEDTERNDEAIPPGALDPDLPSDSPKILERKRRWRKAFKKKYVIDLMDKNGTKRSVPAIKKLVDRYRKEIDKLGPERLPHATKLMEYHRLCGEKGDRNITYFLGNGGGDRKAGSIDDVRDDPTSWSDFVRSCLWKMVRWYYSVEHPEPAFAKKTCRGWIAAERMRRLAALASKEAETPASDDMTIFVDDGTGAKERSVASAKELFQIPVPATFQNWIDRNACEEFVRLRNGDAVASHQIDGNHEHVRAFRPLEAVAMDHTQIDMFVVVLDASGRVIRTFRPYLIVIIDIFSRMILAANLTEEPPSLYTLKEGIKQSLKPKPFIEHLANSTAYFWATDGWGCFRRMLVDNGLENIGISLKAAGDSVGLDINFAPVDTPRFKAIGERFFHTLNTGVWHLADGGVRGKPGTYKDDPSKKAFLTLDAAQERLWNWIVTVYHLDVHETLEMPPARKWSLGFQDYNRPMTNDMNLVDNVFGKYVKRELTTAGIRYENEVYHDPEITSLLIADLLHFNRNKHKGRNKLQSVRLTVECVDSVDDRQVEYVTVYNPVRRAYYRLPNVVQERTGTFAQRKLERQRENLANEEFISSNEVEVNEAAHLATMTRTQVPDVGEGGIAPEAPASRVEGGKLPAAARRVKIDTHNSEWSAGVHEQEQPLERRPATRRGGKKASKKAADARRKAKEEKLQSAKLLEEKIVRAASSRRSSDATPIGGSVDETDAARNLAALLASGKVRQRDSSALRDRVRAKLDSIERKAAG